MTVGPRSALRTTRVARPRRALHRAGARVDRVKLRYRSRPLECRLAPAAGDPAPAVTARSSSSSTGRSTARRPGQLACLMDGDLVVGWGTITRASEARRYRELKLALRTSVSA